jgi:AraC-like DNA-binding protein
MAYDRQRLVREVDAILWSKPHSSLSSICHQLGVERHTIRTAMRQIKQTSFRQYQRELILREATRLLKSKPNLSIKQVAVRLGYRSPLTFSRYFKKATGQRPTELRRG